MLKINKSIMFATTIAVISVPAMSIAGTISFNNARFLDHTSNVEDMIQVNSDWIVGASYSYLNKAHPMYFINIKTEKSRPIAVSDYKIDQDKTSFPDCPGAPDFSKLSTHGVDYYKETNMFYVINHGQRQSVEAFSVESKGHKPPTLVWKGCVIAPPGPYIDAVAGVNKNELIISSLVDMNDKNATEKVKNGLPIGEIYTWSPAQGLKELAISKSISAPNGILASRDGKYIWVAAWGGRYIARINRLPSGDIMDKSATLNFRPDNIRWSDDQQSIYIGGQSASLDSIYECSNSSKLYCPEIKQTLQVMDPQSMVTKELLPVSSIPKMGAGTGAIKAGGKYWLTSFKNDSVIVIPEAK